MQSAQEMTDKPHIIADCDIPFLKGVLEPYADMEYLKGAKSRTPTPCAPTR